MAKLSGNILCPCCSGLKYKKCCQIFHRGVSPKSAEALMRSRYTAYALTLPKYIIDTTHPKNSAYCNNYKIWKEEILYFCNTTTFMGLKIIAVNEGLSEAFVTFEAILSSGLLKEKSHFLKIENRWLYLDGVYETI